MEVAATHTYGPESIQKIEACIDALLPHLTPEEYVFVGGLAIRYHAAVHDIPYPQRPFNDLDIAVKTSESLHPNVCKQFKVGHYPPTALLGNC